MLFEQVDKGDVIIINLDGDSEQKELIYPEVNKVYNVFDDGKIRWSRLEHWKIVEKIDLDKDKVEQDLLEQIADEIKNCYWLYRPEQTVIFKALRVDDDGNVSTESEKFDNGIYNNYVCNFFLATKDNDWFSLGFCTSGLLDVDGSLTKWLEEQE